MIMVLLITLVSLHQTTIKLNYKMASAYAGLLSVLVNTLAIHRGIDMRTDRIHSLKNLSKLGEADMEAIRNRIIKIERLDSDANWTESGLNELSFYDIDLYKDIPGGAIQFIGGAMATLHRVNGPHLI